MVVTPVNSSVEDVVTIPTEVETPLNVDAASIITGFETVLIELPVVVSTTVTTTESTNYDTSYDYAAEATRLWNIYTALNS